MMNAQSTYTVNEYIMRPLDIYGSNIEFEESDNIQEISGNTGNIVVLKALNSIKKQRLLILVIHSLEKAFAYYPDIF